MASQDPVSGPGGEGRTPQRRPGPYEQSLRESRERVEALARERARKRRVRRTAVATAVVVAAGGLGYGGWRVLTQRDVATTVPTAVAQPTSCADPTTVRVAVAPVIAPAVAAVTKELSARSDGPCAAYDIEPAESYAVAGSLAAGPPDAWISDSSTWFARAKAVSGQTIAAGRVIASSPLLVAMPDEAASALGDRRTWADLLSGAPVGLADPNRSQLGVLALGAAATSMADDRLRPVVAAARGGGAAVSLDGVAQGKPARAVVTEAQLIAHNAAKPDSALAAVAPAEGAGLVEYTLVTVTAEAAQQKLVAALAEYLQSDDARKVLQDNGFRTPDGKAPQQPTPLYGVVKVTPAPAPAAVARATALWSAAATKVQALLAVDVSGSMLGRSEGGSRLSIVQRSTMRAAAAASPTTMAALWIYSLHVGTRGDDFRSLLGYGSLGATTHLGAFDRALAGLDRVVGGGSGLYDTIAASYAAAVQNWRPGHLNTVVVISDGPNEDDYGLSLTQLTQRLAQVKNAARPVRLMVVGLGDQIDEAAMRQLTGATGGEYVMARTVDDLGPALTRILGG